MATEAGADYAIVLVPSYFHFAMNEDAIVAFFQEVRKDNSMAWLRIFCNCYDTD